MLHLQVKQNVRARFKLTGSLFGPKWATFNCLLAQSLPCRPALLDPLDGPRSVYIVYPALNAIIFETKETHNASSAFKYRYIAIFVSQNMCLFMCDNDKTIFLMNMWTILMPAMLPLKYQVFRWIDKNGLWLPYQSVQRRPCLLDSTNWADSVPLFSLFTNHYAVPF